MLTVTAAALFVLSHILFPIRGQKEAAFRLAWVTAITEATDDAIEQQTLVRIGIYEGALDPKVLRCERLGDGGKSRGLYQIQPMSAADAKAACGTLQEQTVLALTYVRRSAESCGHAVQDGPEALYRYVSGLCKIDGRAAEMAKRRWGGTRLDLLE